MSATAYFLGAGEAEGYEPFDAGKIRYIRKDDTVVAGIWAVTPEEAPETVEVPFPQDETIYVIEGRVRIEVVGGQTYLLGPGDAGSFVSGTVGRWTILEPLREFFVYS